MTDGTQRLPIERLTAQGRQDAEDLVSRELALTIILDDQELATLLCSPTELEYLAIGFLFSEGLVGGRDEVKKITVDERRGVVWVETREGKERASQARRRRLITSGAYGFSSARGRTKVDSQLQIAAARVLVLVRRFQVRSRLFRETGGAHSAALCDERRILVFSEDIGRYNALDKVLGRCLLDGIPVVSRIMMTTGRVSSGMVLKVSSMAIPILVSRSAPTDLGVRLARDLGITLVGFARGEKMNVYTAGWRIVTGGAPV